jgi:hypothetical protein
VGRVFPRHWHRGRPLNEIVSRHESHGTSIPNHVQRHTCGCPRAAVDFHYLLVERLECNRHSHVVLVVEQSIHHRHRANFDNHDSLLRLTYSSRCEAACTLVRSRRGSCRGYGGGYRHRAIRRPHSPFRSIAHHPHHRRCRCISIGQLPLVAIAFEVAMGKSVTANNALERTGERRGPRLAAAWSSWPAVQRNR